MRGYTAEQLLALERFEEDIRKPPDNRRHGRFCAGWEDYTIRKLEYKPKTLTRLTWTNLGYRMGMRFGPRSRDKMDTLYEMFAMQYETAM